MVDRSLNLCYGIVVSVDKMEEIKKALTDEEYDEMINNYSRRINDWTDDGYFIGIMSGRDLQLDNFIYRISNLAIPSDDDRDLINFKHFFNEHGLWKLINWKPELLLINFCFYTLN